MADWSTAKTVKAGLLSPHSFICFKGLLNGEELSMFIPLLLKKILFGYLLARFPFRSLCKLLLCALFSQKYPTYTSVVLTMPKSVWSAE